jgi:acetyl-CoA carboxylase biotin carboxyl carrier protein
MTRLHERTLEVVSARDNDRITLQAPSPGLFAPTVSRGDLVARGTALGTLEVLGRRTTLLAPDVRGIVDADLAPRPVGYGDALVVLDTSMQIGASTAVAETHATQATTGLVFRAPTSGRFYSRSSPDKPAFVNVGDELGPNATVCLLEVMKTFHRVTYGGPGLPERAKVREILVADGADVTAGDPLLALESA